MKKILKGIAGTLAALVVLNFTIFREYNHNIEYKYADINGDKSQDILYIKHHSPSLFKAVLGLDDDHYFLKCKYSQPDKKYNKAKTLLEKLDLPNKENIISTRIGFSLKDWDNDGNLDISYLAAKFTGYKTFGREWKKVEIVYLNNGKGEFEKRVIMPLE